MHDSNLRLPVSDYRQAVLNIEAIEAWTGSQCSPDRRSMMLGRCGILEYRPVRSHASLRQEHSRLRSEDEWGNTVDGDDRSERAAR